MLCNFLCAQLLQPDKFLFVRVEPADAVAIDVDDAVFTKRTAKGVDRGKHQEHAKQEQRDRRDVAGAAAIGIFARQPAGMERQHRYGAPDLAFEMEHPVRQVVKERADGAVDMRRLAAGMAMAAHQRGTAVEAGRRMRAARLLPRDGFDGARGDRASYAVTHQSLENPIARHASPHS
ncbi:MAG: hypothetical protein NVS3B27_12930 [Novosphingobium sp.]